MNFLRKHHPTFGLGDAGVRWCGPGMVGYPESVLQAGLFTDEEAAELSAYHRVEIVPAKEGIAHIERERAALRGKLAECDEVERKLAVASL